MILTLLIFQRPDLPAPLWELSPWLDWMVTPQNQVYDRLARQEHRRIIKTHTPLDGVPIDPRATYVVVGRHPLDICVSLYYHNRNIDRARIRELCTAVSGVSSPPDTAAQRSVLLSLREWLVSWIDTNRDPRQNLDSLPGILWHLSDAWFRRHSENVVLVHFDDLSVDLDQEMRRLARLLRIDVDEALWPTLVNAATFRQMREKAGVLVPGPNGIFRDQAAFFRSGKVGSGRCPLDERGLARYHYNAAQLAPADMLDWLHRGR